MSEDKVIKPVPRRKLPMRAKSSDGSKKITGRPAPPDRSKSFDDSMQSMRNLMTKANSAGGRSMRGLLATANSAKNVMAAGTEQAVKVHTMLATKAPKARPGAVAVKSLSSKHMNAGLKDRSRSPLVRGLSVDRISIRNRSKSRGREGAAKPRGGKKPDSSLTPSNHNRRKDCSRTPSNHNRRKDCSLTPSNHNRRKERVILGKDDDEDGLDIA